MICVGMACLRSNVRCSPSVMYHSLLTHFLNSFSEHAHIHIHIHIQQSPAPFLLQAFYFGGRVAGRVKIGKAKTAILKHAFVLMIAHGLVLFYD